MFRVFRRHLSPAEADGWLGWAATQAVAHATICGGPRERYKSQKEFEQEVVETLWNQLWMGLALADPDLFLFPPSRLGPVRVGTPLAFLYLQKQSPLPELELSPEEQRIFDEERRWAYQWTGLPALRRPARFYVVGKKSRLLWRRLEFSNTSGTALCHHRRLRNVVLVSERFIREERAMRPYHPVLLVRLLIHESVHSAVGAAANTRCDGPWSDLSWNLHEGFAAIIEAAALSRAVTEEEPVVRDVRESLVGGSYTSQAQALLRLFPAGEYVSRFAPRLARAVVAAEQARSDAEVASALNALVPRARTPQQWLRSLVDD